jgi:hypothetical protein
VPAKTKGEVRLDESNIDISGAQSGGVTDFAEGSPGGDEVATVRACQCPPNCGNFSPTKPVIGWMSVKGKRYVRS